MGWIKRRGSSTEKPHIPEDVFQKLKNEYPERIKGYAEEHSVPPELIINLDHTGIHLAPVGGWTMELEGAKKVPIINLDDKRQITAIFAGKPILWTNRGSL